MDYTDLRNKTIFDFTNDTSLIEEITGCTSVDSYLRKYHFVNRMGSIIVFAKKTNDTELEKTARKAEREAHKQWDKLVAEYAKQGLLIS